MGLGRLPGGVEPVGPKTDTPARVGEADGVQPPAAAPDHGLPDPAAGFHQIHDVVHPYALFGQRSFHTFTLSVAPLRRK